MRILTSNGDVNMKIKTILGVLLVIALVALAGCQQKTEQTINVQGSSEMTFDPNEAEVWAGISVVKVTAEDAQNEANKVINAIIDGLRYKGFTEKDISTEQLSLYEEYRWEDNTNKVVGWRATQILKVKTTDLTKVGTIVDVAVNNGATNIQNINFGLSNDKEQEYKAKALAEATASARAKAETIAKSLGVKLGKIQSVSESNFYYTPYRYAMAEMAGSAAVKEAATVLPQKVDVSAQISLVYIIEQ